MDVRYFEWGREISLVQALFNLPTWTPLAEEQLAIRVCRD